MMNKPGENLTKRNIETNEIIYSTLRNKSLFNPPIGNEGHVEVFRKMFFKDLHDLKIKRVHDPGDIKSGIKNFEDRKDVVIREVY